MKSFSLTAVTFICSVVLSIFLLRISGGRKSLTLFLMAYAFGILIYFSFYRLTPANLWIFQETSLEHNATVDFWNGILIFTLSFHCFVDVSFATVLTGFATNLMVHLIRRGRLTVNEVEKIYGITEEHDPIIDWRLNHLVRGHYMVRDQDGYRLQFKGKVMAAIALFLQRLFHTGECG